jgi:L-malate glycosyltransferase
MQPAISFSDKPGHQFDSPRKKVSIVNVQLSPFRIPLFNQLRAELRLRNIDLYFIYGDVWPAERDRNYDCSLDWAIKVSNRFIPIGGGRYACWQQLPHPLLEQSDLVVMTQENMILSNYPLILKRRKADKRLAFWGHGVSRKSHSTDSLGERWRRIWTNKADWWFGYTQISVDALKHAGFPEERITNTNNAIDNMAFLQDAEKVTGSMLATIREQCKLDEDSVVGLYCGALYADKQLDLLVEAADLVHQQNPSFRLIVVGSGAEAGYIETAFRTRAWATAVGPKSGVEKAAYFKLASMVLNTGAVGLVVIDAFCMGLPILTVKEAMHGPESVFIEEGTNGFFTEANSAAYAEVISSLIRDQDLYARIKEGAERSGRKYTINNMVQNFANGIEACLEQPLNRNN